MGPTKDDQISPQSPFGSLESCPFPTSFSSLGSNDSKSFSRSSSSSTDSYPSQVECANSPDNSTLSSVNSDDSTLQPPPVECANSLGSSPQSSVKSDDSTLQPPPVECANSPGASHQSSVKSDDSTLQPPPVECANSPGASHQSSVKGDDSTSSPSSSVSSTDSNNCPVSSSTKDKSSVPVNRDVRSCLDKDASETSTNPAVNINSPQSSVKSDESDTSPPSSVKGDDSTSSPSSSVSSSDSNTSPESSSTKDKSSVPVNRDVSSRLDQHTNEAIRNAAVTVMQINMGIGGIIEDLANSPQSSMKNDDSNTSPQSSMKSDESYTLSASLSSSQESSTCQPDDRPRFQEETFFKKGLFRDRDISGVGPSHHMDNLSTNESDQTSAKTERNSSNTEDNQNEYDQASANTDRNITNTEDNQQSFSWDGGQTKNKYDQASANTDRNSTNTEDNQQSFSLDEGQTKNKYDQASANTDRNRTNTEDNQGRDTFGYSDENIQSTDVVIEMLKRKGYERPDDRPRNSEEIFIKKGLFRDPDISGVGPSRPIHNPSTSFSWDGGQTRNESDQTSADTNRNSSNTEDNQHSFPWDWDPTNYETKPKLGQTKEKKRRTRCCCSTRKTIIVGVVIGVLLIGGLSVGIHYIKSMIITEVACQFLNNAVICPFQSDYNWISILNPQEYVENGKGRTSHRLTNNTDVTINGFNIQVKNNLITVRNEPKECSQQGEYPITIHGTNDSVKTETKMLVKVEDVTDVVEMEATPFVHATHNKEYIQIRCTGYHKCGTVVMDAEIRIPGLSTYTSPMECSRTNIDGTAMESYGYACTLIMAMDKFRRTDSLKCKPTVETLRNTTTKSIAQTSVVVNATTHSKFFLEKGKNSTINFNVNLQYQDDIGRLQTKYNGVFSANEFNQDDRKKFSTKIIGNIAKCKLDFYPATCIDEGQWTLHLRNGTLTKWINVTGTPTFTPCPPVVNVQVGERRHLDFSYCVPDDVHTYALDLYGKMNKTGSFLRDKPIHLEDKNITFHARLKYNELSVAYNDNVDITCSDHMTTFIMSLTTNAGVGKRSIMSLTNVKVGHGDYTTYSTGGDFRENFPAYINLSVNLGCRPENLTIHINGSLLTSTYNLIVDPYTGEKIFSKSFSFPKITMSDNGSLAEVYSSFIDDEGSSRNLNITQEIRVLPDSFCQEKPHGCHYNHPYNRNMWVACGEGVIASLLNCQPGLVFVQSSCKGECCYERSTDRCQSVY